MMRFIQIDEEGYFASSGIRIADEEYGSDLLNNLYVEDRVFKTQSEGTAVIVEAYDAPYVALGLRGGAETSQNREARGTLTLELPYGVTALFRASTLHVDEWDRFHGVTLGGVPFVFSRAAQMQFFDMVDEFDDDSFTLDGAKYLLTTLDDADVAASGQSGDVNSKEYWNNTYVESETAGEVAPWDLNEVSAPLRDVLPQIKMPRSRVCVLGAGAAHDAAYLAAQGHFVTAIDISEAAIAHARKLYPENSNLKYVVADAFEFARQNVGQFDLIFEHTFFCAIDPHRREELVKSWRMMLAESGHFLGIMFAMARGEGPPFGSSEWELRRRLDSRFEMLYWTRWKTSVPRRLGRELVIYARLKHS